MTETKPGQGGAAIMPYLFFGGRCEEALEFYRAALGARVEAMMRFNEGPGQPPPGTLPPGFENKIMHASFRVRGTEVMASDGMKEGTNFAGFSLCLSVATLDEARKVFTLLQDGGESRMPLGETFFSPCFGMVADRFGVEWMVIVPAEMKA